MVMVHSCVESEEVSTALQPTKLTVPFIPNLYFLGLSSALELLIAHNLVIAAWGDAKRPEMAEVLLTLGGRFRATKRYSGATRWLRPCDNCLVDCLVE